MRARTLATGLCLLGACLGPPLRLAAQAPPDSLPSEAAHTPRGALWRAAVLPGWGQYYNGQAYKMPIVYAGLAGLTATALYWNHEYLVFRRAALYAAYHDAPQPPGTYSPDLVAAYNRARARLGLQPEEALPPAEQAAQRARYAPLLRQIRDTRRRNRDLSYFGIGLAYGLSVLDAYVSAHLLTFDVGEDLSLRVAPAPAGLRLDVRF